MLSKMKPNGSKKLNKIRNRNQDVATDFAVNRMPNRETESAALTTITRVQHRSHSRLLLMVSLSLLVPLRVVLAAVDNIGVYYQLDPNYKYYPPDPDRMDYRSNTYHGEHAFAWFFHLSYKILWWLMGPTQLPKGYIEFEDMKFKYGPKVENNDWSELLMQYWGVMLLGMIIIVLAIIVPLVGLCCCCRMFGNRGEQNFCDEKNDRWKRCLYSLLFLIPVIILFCAVIVVFACNGMMDISADDSTQAVRDASADLLKFLEHTAKLVWLEAVQRMNELKREFQSMWKKATDHIITRLQQMGNEFNYDVLTVFVDKLPMLREVITDMKKKRVIVENIATQLSNALEGFYQQIENNREICEYLLGHAGHKNFVPQGHSEYETGGGFGFGYGGGPTTETPKGNLTTCIEAMEMIDKYNKVYKEVVDMMPLINVSIVYMDMLILELLGEASLRSRYAKSTALEHFQETVDDLTLDLNLMLKMAENDVRHMVDEFRVEVRKISDMIKRNIDRFSFVTQNFLKDYSQYRFYLGIFVCVSLLGALLLCVAALAFGCCGVRPSCDGYNNHYCNKGVGSTLLGCAVLLMFATFSVISLIALLHLLLGVAAHRGICMPLRDPLNDEVFGVIDNAWDLNYFFIPPTKINKTHNFLPPLRISDIVHGCHLNKSIYEVIHGENIFDLDELYDHPTRKRFTEMIENIVDDLDFRQEDMEIYNNDTLRRIKRISTKVFEAIFKDGTFTDNLTYVISSYNVKELRLKFSEAQFDLISREGGKGPGSAIRKSMRIWFENFDRLYVYTYQNLLRNSEQLTHLAYKLNFLFPHPYTSKPETARRIVVEIEKMQEHLVKMRSKLKHPAEEIAERFLTFIEFFLKTFIEAVKSFGKCGPLATAYDACVVMLCDRVVDPLNGFWCASLFSVLFFLPMICLALALSRLYSKTNSYQGPICDNFVVVASSSSSISILITDVPSTPDVEEEEPEPSTNKALFFVVERSIVTDDEDSDVDSNDDEISIDVRKSSESK